MISIQQEDVVSGYEERLLNRFKTIQGSQESTLFNWVKQGIVSNGKQFRMLVQGIIESRIEHHTRIALRDYKQSLSEEGKEIISTI